MYIIRFVFTCVFRSSCVTRLKARIDQEPHVDRPPVQGGLANPEKKKIPVRQEHMTRQN